VLRLKIASEELLELLCCIDLFPRKHHYHDAPFGLPGARLIFDEADGFAPNGPTLGGG
jgi:hypothetical protein